MFDRHPRARLPPSSGAKASQVQKPQTQHNTTADTILFCLADSASSVATACKLQVSERLEGTHPFPCLRSGQPARLLAVAVDRDFEMRWSVPVQQRAPPAMYPSKSRMESKPF